MTSIPARAAVVTAAATGIGRAVALRLAQDGFDVAVNGTPRRAELLNTLAEEIGALGRKAIVVIGDISQEDVVQRLVDKAVAELGELYVMVANAGVGTPIESLVDISLETWEHYLSVNLTGTFLCYRAAARQMLKQGHGGRIIGATSIFGKRGEAYTAAYSSTKFGIRGLTQALATELAQEGITVNAYAPGFIDTPLLRSSIFASLKSDTSGDDARLMDVYREAAPMKKIGTTGNVAALVSYLVSDEAGFMTGQSVSLNGGMFYD